VRVYDALMETETAMTVGTVALLAGVTARTLHHYDEIGLVSPDGHTDAGYRLYSRRNIERLQGGRWLGAVPFGRYCCQPPTAVLG
jgi:hypothetical protein